MPPAIEFDGATKQYGEKRIGPVRFSVGRGEIFGFLGPNGSGKSTCIRMLLGLAAPSAGSVRLGGLDPIRRHTEALSGVGYSPELPNLQTFMTPREILELVAAETGRGARSEIDTVLEQVGIVRYGSTKVGKLSKGMVQRLSVAQALIGSPHTLVLDEPMIGLDPAGTAHLREAFRAFAKGGGTILMSSHMMSEVEDLCTSIGLIHNGNLLFSGTPKEMIASTLGEDEVRVEAEGLTPGVLESVRRIQGILEVEQTPYGLDVKVSRGAEVRPEIARLIVEAGGRLLTIREGERLLERSYIEVLKAGSAPK